MRELAKMHTNLLPRLHTLKDRLGRNGAILESWEIQSVMSYFDHQLRKAYQEIEQDYRSMNQLTMGLPAVRTTPLFATEEDVRSS